MAYMNPTANLGANTPQNLALMNSFMPKPTGQRGINLPPGTPLGGVPLGGNQQRFVPDGAGQRGKYFSYVDEANKTIGGNYFLPEQGIEVDANGNELDMRTGGMNANYGKPIQNQPLQNGTLNQQLPQRIDQTTGMAYTDFRGDIAARNAQQQQAQQQAQQQQYMPQQQQYMQQQPMGGNYGLAGAEQALMAGLGGGSNALNQGMMQGLGTLQQGQTFAQNQLNQGRQALSGNFSASAQQVNPMTGQPLFQQAAQGVGAYSPAGLQAQGLQSALSGAQGQQAFDNAFINSPVQQFLREQGQQSVINQATALGGLGGGEVQKELTRFGQGLAGTQLQQQIQNLGALSGQGLQAAGQQGQFLSQAGQQQGNLAGMNAQMGTQANIASAGNRLNAANNMAQLFGQGAGIGSNLASQGAGYQMNTGQNIANLMSGTGTNIANARSQAGRDLATSLGNSTSALADLANQQGSGLADIIGSGGSNIANLLSQQGMFDSGQQTQLAQILANLSTGQGSQLSNLAQNQGTNQANLRLSQGQGINDMIGNLGGAYMMNQAMQSPSIIPASSPSNYFGTGAVQGGNYGFDTGYLTGQP